VASPALGVQPHIGVVIAGDGSDALRRAKVPQPLRGKHEFLGKPEIDEIAGDRDVVGLAPDNILREHVEHVAPMHELPPLMPIHKAEDAFAEEVAAPRPGHRAQMNVGQVR
jgi:hypothetical protein